MVSKHSGKSSVIYALHLVSQQFPPLLPMKEFQYVGLIDNGQSCLFKVDGWLLHLVSQQFPQMLPMKEVQYVSLIDNGQSCPFKVDGWLLPWSIPLILDVMIFLALCMQIRVHSNSSLQRCKLL